MILIKINSTLVFLKFLTKKSGCVLWDGASYRPGNTVLCYYLILFLTKLPACLSNVYQQLEVLLGNVPKPAEEQKEGLD
jgi:hypothetical protein